MATYVIYNGEVVDRQVVDMIDAEFRDKLRANYPSPRVSRMESFDSPVDGKSISSWRQRDRDMQAVDAADPRDLPRKPFEKRHRAIERMKEADNG